jgi:multicomponent Na+:H+ antiporter subunit B
MSGIEPRGGAVSESVYVESSIIMTTVRVVAPFVLTFGLFVMLHGADTPGGGFQGGVVVGAVVMMLAFAFGVDATRAWADRRIVTALASGGVLTFVLVGLGSMALGGTFLEYHAYDVHHASKYGIELVELGIRAIVAGVVTALFFQLSAGFEPGSESGEGE